MTAEPTRITRAERADYEFAERVAILMEANGWPEAQALAKARQDRDGLLPGVFA